MPPRPARHARPLGTTPDSHSTTRPGPTTWSRSSCSRLVADHRPVAGARGRLLLARTSPSITMSGWAKAARPTSSPRRPASWPAPRPARRTARRTTTPRRGSRVLGLKLQKWGGVGIPVNSARTSCSSPCGRQRATPHEPGAGHLGRPADQQAQASAATAYADALAKAPDGDPAQVGAGDYGPVPALAAGLPGAGAVGRPRGLAHVVGHLLRRRPDAQHAAALRRRLPRGPPPSPTTSAATSGA